METALSVWIEDNVQKNMPLSGLLIHTKAMHMYAYLAGAGGTSTSDTGMRDAGISGVSLFQGSRGWFDCLKKRYSLRNIKLTGECASEDYETAKMLPVQLAQLIEEKGYLPELVFNADETGLFWEKNANGHFYLEARGDSIGIQGRKEPGISSPLHKCKRPMTI